MKTKKTLKNKNDQLFTKARHSNLNNATLLLSKNQVQPPWLLSCSLLDCYRAVSLTAIMQSFWLLSCSLFDCYRAVFLTAFSYNHLSSCFSHSRWFRNISTSTIPMEDVWAFNIRNTTWINAIIYQRNTIWINAIISQRNTIFKNEFNQNYYFWRNKV